MKTSNKLIIGLIAAPFIIMSFVDAALYNKFKKGEFTLQSNIDEQRKEKLMLGEDVKSVQLSNLYNVEVILSDSNYIEWDKNNKRDIAHELTNGLLTIGLKKEFQQANTDALERPKINSYEQVKLHLKNVQQIDLTDCMANLTSDSKSKVDTVRINQKHDGELSIGINDRPSTNTVVKATNGNIHFNHLFITSESALTIQSEVIIKSCKINLTGSSLFTASGWPFENLDLDMADNSRINVSSLFYERYLNKNATKPVAAPTPVAPK